MPSIYSIIVYSLVPSVFFILCVSTIDSLSPKLLDETHHMVDFRFKSWQIIILYTFFSAPIQEVMFRWFYIGRFQQTGISMIVVIFISALVFGLAHLPFSNLFLVISTFIAGLWWGYIYLHTGNLWYPIISHIIVGNFHIWMVLYPHRRLFRRKQQQS
jgi:membrane protease YdiL (CAAX protease family)